MPESQDIYDAASRAKGWFAEHGKTTQIAFFGGSFTAIDKDYMISLLTAARDVVQSYGLEGIRISTRPDKIDEEILKTLKDFGVTSIELGAQSMCDEVLTANNRGHFSKDVIKASELIKENDFELGLQMMTGLYKDTEKRAVETAKRLIALRPRTIRIYPALVLANTHLQELMEKNMYKPQTLDEAAELCGKLITKFEDKGIKVIRVGLHDEPSLKDGFIAGPYHPAFKELCLSRNFLNRLLAELKSELAKSGEFRYNVLINPRTYSVAVGQKRKNITELSAQGFQIQMKQDSIISPGDFMIERAN